MLRAIRSNLLSSCEIVGLVLSATLPSTVSADVRNSTYTYDALGRLTTVCDAGVTVELRSVELR
jgi:YD repeat-containing protein